MRARLTGQVRRVVLCGVALAACGKDASTRVASDGAPDAPVAERGAAGCSDGVDNDGDGLTDCADPDCLIYIVCLDGGRVPRDAAMHPDASEADALAPDLPARPDLEGADLQQLDGSSTCSNTCDCPQGWFCHQGACVRDPKLAVHCCAKPGCPPGKLCLDLAGQRSTCSEDPAFACSTACDCGPTHCCVNGTCVKDTADPWQPGGVAVAGLNCTIGTDPTYCCEDFACHEGRAAYEAAGLLPFFKCYDPRSDEVGDTCGGNACFGTACNCETDEACIDTVTKPAPPAGATCHLASGGTCVSIAAATSIFGWKAADVLPCCRPGCQSQTACDAGWKREGGRYAYQRVVASCGPCADGLHHGCGLCGNGSCDEGEYPAICPQDCTCGDGRCAPEEAKSTYDPATGGSTPVCAQDCGTCGDGICDPSERPERCTKYCTTCIESCTGCADCNVCGDGWCTADELASCPQDCLGACRDATLYDQQAYKICGDGQPPPRCAADLKTCPNCRHDCPVPPWKVSRPEHGGPLEAVWGSASNDVYAAGERALLRFDGSAWTAVPVTNMTSFSGVWGSSASDVYVIGTAGDQAAAAHYDGKAWNVVMLPALAGVPYERMVLTAVGGSSATDVHIAAALYVTDSYSWDDCHSYGCPVVTYQQSLGCVTWRFDGLLWSQGPGYCVSAIWGVPDDLFTVDGLSSLSGLSAAPAGYSHAHLHAGVWSATHSDVPLAAVWGSSTTSLFAAGEKMVAAFDGSAWKPLLDISWSRGVWGSSPSDVFVVGGSGTQPPYILHYDGSSWQQVDIDLPGDCARLEAVWGSASGHFFAVGEASDEALVLSCGGSDCAPIHSVAMPSSSEPDLAGPAPTVPFGPYTSGCGNGWCDAGESCSGGSTPETGIQDYYKCYTDACPADCCSTPTSTCGDGICEEDESCDGRSGTLACADCPGKDLGPVSKQYCCVEGVCVGQGCPVTGCP